MDFWGYQKRVTAATSVLFAIVLVVAVLMLTGVWPVLDGHFGIPVRRGLKQILRSDTLRVITRNHPLSYYIYRGTRRGFDFELINRFAEEQGLVIEVVVPPEWSDMIPWLYQGKGDVIAAQLTVTPERERQVLFTRPYLQVHQVAVGTEEQPPPRTIEEFVGRKVMVRRGSSYEERLKELQREGIDLEIVYHDELGEEDDPVQFVARGRFPLTVVDNSIARLEQHFYPGLVLGTTISEPQDIAWAVRPNSRKLRAALDEFLRRHERSTFFNVLKSRYFDDPDRFLKHRSAQLSFSRKGRISNYDSFFRSAGEETGIDWRLLAAQAYHESRFRPNKISWAGAVGLMQVMPRTARDMGITEYYRPRDNILAGARYLRKLYDLYSFARTDDDRIRISLAAYNAGIGHLYNARRLAVEAGGDSTRWNDVARGLSMLEQPKYFRRDGFSFVRGRMVRRYVDDVLNRYQIFVDLMNENGETNPAQYVQKR